MKYHIIQHSANFGNQTYLGAVDSWEELQNFLANHSSPMDSYRVIKGTELPHEDKTEVVPTIVSKGRIFTDLP